MAAISAAGNGNWNSTTPNAPWPSGIVPTSADQVTIPSTRTVTLDGAASVDTLTIASGGTLNAASTGTLTLTAQNDITVARGGTMNLDVSAGTATLTVNLNASNNAAGRGILNNGALTLKGASRTRWTRLNGAITAGATSAVVDSAAGWAVGDTVVFATTQAYDATPRVDVVTLTSVSGNTIGWTGGITYAHDDDGRVGDFNSNLTVRPNTLGQRNFIVCNTNTSSPAPAVTIQQVAFNEIFASTTFPNEGIVLRGVNNFPGTFTVEDCAFLNARASGITIYQQTRSASIRLRRNILYTTASLSGGIVYAAQALTALDAVIEDHVVFRSAGSGVNVGAIGLALNRFYVSACNVGIILTDGAQVYDSEVESCYHGMSVGAGISVGASNIVVARCSIGSRYSGAYAAGTAGPIRATSENGNAIFVDCNWQATGIVGSSSLGAKSSVFNKNGDLDQQEFYYLSARDTPLYKKQVSLAKNANASIEVAHDTSYPVEYAFQVLAKSGETITLKVNVRKSSSPAYGAATLPSVTVSGLGITPVVATMSSGTAADTWETLTVNATNTAPADGLLTVTLAAQSETAGAKSWFSGIPAAPYITRARHYGFTFDETNPVLKTNPYTVASEATAAAYTGVTVNATTKRVSFGIGTADTLAKVYDYSQAWAVLNIDKEVPWQRAGALLSLTSGWTVVDPVISGVTWGGVIEWNTPGAISGSFDSTTFRFNAAGTYDLSGGTFAGTINLTNTSGGGVIVIVLPSGIDYVNDDPGSITVEVAVESATASITNIVPGSRLQVYNVTEDTEMVNTIVAGTSWSVGYPNGTGYSTGDVVRVRLAWMDGVEAKLPVQYQTVASSTGWAILADQQDDEVYNYNAIDGDTCTEFSHDFVNVQVDVDDADNTTTVQRGYAWFIAGQMTADGIRYFYGGITAEDAVNYRINAALVNLRIQNIKVDSNLSVTGGNIYRSDDTDIFAPGASGSTASMRYGRAYTVRVGGGTGLSPEESAKLMSLPSASTVASAVDASTVLAKEETAAAAKNNAALAAALSA